MATDIIARGIAANAAANLDAFKAQTAEALAGKADLIDGKIPADQLPSYVDDVTEYATLADFPATGEFGKIYVALDTGYTYRWSGSDYIQIGGQDLSVITANFASLYDSSSTYELGDLCIYEDALYVAAADIDPAEPWDPSHWTPTNLADVIDALRAVMEAELETKQDELVSGENIKTVAGKSILGSGDLEVTKSDVGLGNVDDTSDADKPVSTAQQAALDLKLDVADYVVDDEISGTSENPVQNKVIKAALDEKVNVGDTTNFEVSEDQVAGAPLLGSITIDDDPYNIPTKTSDLTNDSGFVSEVDDEISDVSENPVQNKVIKAALDEKQDELVSGTSIKTLEGQSLLGSGNIDLTKADVGLDNVDNTSDADKPVSTAQQAALDLKLNAADYIVDNEISDSSENPVQNKVIKAALDEKADIDDTTDFEVSEDQVAGALMLGSITIDDDSYNIPKKTSDLQNDAGFVTDAYHDPTKLDQKPDGTNNLISSATGKVSETYLPDYILGQLLYGGLFDSTTATATLSDGAKGRLGTSAVSIVLTNDATPITGYVSNEGIYYVVSAAGTFAGLDLVAGDWLISTGSAWLKVDNTDEVTSVNGMTGAVTLTKGDIGLGNVDDTSDLDKPISTAVQAALDEKVDEADMDDFELNTDQVANKPFLGSVTVGEGTYNVPKRFSDLQDDVGLLYVDDQSANVLTTIGAADWADLKDNHYLKASAPVFPTAEETRYKLSINGVDHLARVSKNSDSQAKAMFMVQESDGSDVFYYEVTMFMIAVSANSTALVFRCATVMSEPVL